MAEAFHIDISKTALLTLDCQKGITEYAKGCEVIFPRVAKVLTAARAKNLRIIHVGIGFRPGYPELSPDHPTFGRIRDQGRFIIDSESARFHESLALQEEELIVYKHRVSAFSGNDLEMILRAQGIKHLVFFGIATSGIVLSTLRQAADLDFHCTVIKDCCFDADEEVHRVLTEKVFTRQAKVIDTETFVK